MSSDVWRERERALEESFFMRRNQELLEQLKQDLATERRKEALSEACGITDDTLLDLLVEADLDGESIAALALVPLVAVAWADGKMDQQERKAILSATQSEGIEAGSVCYRLLERWLDDPPEESLVVAWKDFVANSAQRFSPQALAAFHDEVIGRARKVAQAAGGILGVHRISDSERAVLADLEAAFPE